MSTDTDVRTAISAERSELAAVLSALAPAQWEVPSLCKGWRVKEVVAHLEMPFRYSTPRFLLELARSRGSFHRMADRLAKRDAAELPIAELVSTLQRNVDHAWKPPGGGYAGALSHDLIHGLDITVPLGLDRVVPPDRVRIVLGGLKPKQIKYFGVDIDGVELRATDIDWRYGSGRPLEGAAQDLLLAVCGRRVPPGRLSGVDAARFEGA